jgi:CO dehydrogenase/acetyl-CoA synthase epsilon subunit
VAAAGQMTMNSTNHNIGEKSTKSVKQISKLHADVSSKIASKIKKPLMVAGTPVTKNNNWFTKAKQASETNSPRMSPNQ